jgi:hypothetical protein
MAALARGNGIVVAPVALLVVGLWGIFIVLAPASAADLPTVCVAREVIRFSPGLWLSRPTSGTGGNAGEPGTAACSGPIEGRRPTGTIRVSHREITYGYIDPDTCLASESSGVAVYNFPTVDGTVEVESRLTVTFSPLGDPLALGRFTGERLSGLFAFRPLEGDCVTSPLTLVEAIWVGTWHGKSGAG